MVGRVRRRYSRSKRRNSRTLRKRVRSRSLRSRRSLRKNRKSLKGGGDQGWQVKYLKDYEACFNSKYGDKVFQRLMEAQIYLEMELDKWGTKIKGNKVTVDDIENERKKYNITPETGFSIEAPNSDETSTFDKYLNLLDRIKDQVDKKKREVWVKHKFTDLILIDETEKDFETIYKIVAEHAGYNFLVDAHAKQAESIPSWSHATARGI
jgi:hypothetical protein